jgi:hypothetical protein
MDRSELRRPVGYSAMQTPRDTSIKLLLRTGGAECIRIVAHEAHRRNIHGQTLLRLSTDYARVAERRTQCESQASSRRHEASRISREPTGPQHLEEPSAAPQIPIPPTWSRNPQTSPRVEYGHHVHSIAEWFRISRGGNRLVQSPGAFAPPLEQPRDRLLPRGIRGSDQGLRPTGHLQYGPRRAVHFTGICECGTRKGHPLQYGWSRASPRQRLCRTPMEVCEI